MVHRLLPICVYLRQKQLPFVIDRALFLFALSPCLFLSAGRQGQTGTGGHPMGRQAGNPSPAVGVVKGARRSVPLLRNRFLRYSVSLIVNYLQRPEMVVYT